MRKLTGRPGRQQGDETMQPPTSPPPWIARSVSTEFGRRHVRGVAIARLLVAIGMVTAGSIYCASGHWWGALLVRSGGTEPLVRQPDAKLEAGSRW